MRRVHRGHGMDVWPLTVTCMVAGLSLYLAAGASNVWGPRLALLAVVGVLGGLASGVMRLSEAMAKLIIAVLLATVQLSFWWYWRDALVANASLRWGVTALLCAVGTLPLVACLKFLWRKYYEN